LIFNIKYLECSIKVPFINKFT